MRIRLTGLLLLGTLAIPTALRGQLVSAGFGPAFPTSRMQSSLDPGTGLMLFGRVSLPVFPLLDVQVELARTTWAWRDGAARELSILQPGAVAVLPLGTVSSVRPYLMAGASFSRQKLTSTGLDDDTAWRFGYQAGLGAEYRGSVVTPFVELRWVSLDAPGSVRYTFVPLLVGVRVL